MKKLFAFSIFILLIMISFADASGIGSYGATGVSGTIEKGMTTGAFIPRTIVPGLLQKLSGTVIKDYLEFGGNPAALQYSGVTIPGGSLADWNAGTMKFKFWIAPGEAMTNGDTITIGIECVCRGSGDSQNYTFPATNRVTATATYAAGDQTDPIWKQTSATGALTVLGTPAAGKNIECNIDAASTNSKKVWIGGMDYQYTSASVVAW